MNRLLVVDDDPLIIDLIEGFFPAPAWEVESAADGAAGLEAFRARRPDVVLLDVLLPDVSGLDLFGRLRDLDSRVPVIFITVSVRSSVAIEAVKLGCFEYVFKPFGRGEITDLVTRAVQARRWMSVPVALGPQEPADGDLLLGRCPAMQEVYRTIGRVAPHDVTVLIQGESGTGKELAARALYQHSRRAARPFLAINCASIPETLLESELFGHEKGAFTGAERQRVGRFEQCHGGTLFLDEVGDMPPALQSKILRVLQEQQFQRVGGVDTVTTDVRLIAATHRDLSAMARQGAFREDLYYRLSVVTVHLPPLRERGDDLPDLIAHLWGRFCRQSGREVALSPEALAVLTRYPWPGNVRELQNVVQSAILQAAGPAVFPDDLPRSVREPGPRPSPESSWERLVEEDIRAGGKDLYARALERMERLLLTRVLRHTGGHQTRAAEVLGITRGSLRHKLRALGLEADHFAGGAADAAG
jgi:two-component system nitrogen regulation response regulator GlnG